MAFSTKERVITESETSAITKVLFWQLGGVIYDAYCKDNINRCVFYLQNPRRVLSSIKIDSALIENCRNPLSMFAPKNNENFDMTNAEVEAWVRNYLQEGKQDEDMLRMEMLSRLNYLKSPLDTSPNFLKTMGQRVFYDTVLTHHFNNLLAEWAAYKTSSTFWPAEDWKGKLAIEARKFLMLRINYLFEGAALNDKDVQFYFIFLINLCETANAKLQELIATIVTENNWSIMLYCFILQEPINGEVPRSELVLKALKLLSFWNIEVLDEDGLHIIAAQLRAFAVSDKTEWRVPAIKILSLFDDEFMAVMSINMHILSDFNQALAPENVEKIRPLIDMLSNSDTEKSLLIAVIDTLSVFAIHAENRAKMVAGIALLEKLINHADKVIKPKAATLLKIITAIPAEAPHEVPVNTAQNTDKKVLINSSSKTVIQNPARLITIPTSLPFNEQIALAYDCLDLEYSK